ncbi:hypothetical protein NIASO_17940 [Niabella soli DSM 19437]|uniref:DUF3667 domain-containing protein n=2 Tax=Niabella TaxID=379899 RepID=W0F923_9BACT|nr:hypothetical protein NIASO_17940 [Niabella soli DSM 19437]
MALTNLLMMPRLKKLQCLYLYSYFTSSKAFMHKKHRAENNCLNCGNTVEQLFCTHCGQENLQLHDSTWHYISHYFQDLFHYDGKFWHTIKNLFIKPGQVAKEFCQGKRFANLDPVRLYVFVSTVFFLLFFLIPQHQDETKRVRKEYSVRLNNLDKEKEYLKGTPAFGFADSLYKAVADENQKWERKEAIGKALKAGADSLTSAEVGKEIDSDYAASIADTIKEQKDILQQQAQDSKSLFDRMKQKKAAEEYGGDEQKMQQAVVDRFLHNLPKVVFASLPFFAFFLWLLHRRNTRKTYGENLAFSIYYYSFVFIIMLAGIVLTAVGYRITNENAARLTRNWLAAGIFFYLFFYFTLAMKLFFGESFRRALFKQTLCLLLTAAAGVLVIAAAYLILFFIS